MKNKLLINSMMSMMKHNNKCVIKAIDILVKQISYKK